MNEDAKQFVPALDPLVEIPYLNISCTTNDFHIMKEPWLLIAAESKMNTMSPTGFSKGPIGSTGSTVQNEHVNWVTQNIDYFFTIDIIGI